MNQHFLRRIWGNANALLDRPRRAAWTDLLLIVGLAGLLVGLVQLGQEWSGEHRPAVEIDLSPWALPQYTFFSLTRGLVAYGFSLLFTLVYGYWAAKDQLAQRVLIPLLDILQSIPVLGFMPGLVLALVAVFPRSNIGLELAAILMIFTGQAWNMTFSFYQSVRSVPQDFQEVASVYGYNWWQRFRWLELPFSGMGLVWNSMMSMAGGWFFLMINEAFKLGDKDYRLPGIGSYMSQAVEQRDHVAMLWAILAMVAMIVALDQLFWRPVVVWAQKFRVEEGGQQEAMTSWFLGLLRRSRLLRYVRRMLHSVRVLTPAWNAAPVARSSPSSSWSKPLSLALLLTLVTLLGYGGWKLLGILGDVELSEWQGMAIDAGWTLGRVLLATVIGTLWAVPAGLAIGLSPRLSRVLQPVVQVTASFPAPMLFPIVVGALTALGWTLDWVSIVLMLLGTQWYILFNVIAGAMAVPADLREAARSYRIAGWQRFWAVYLPAVFPYLVTGWVTAAGGAWNASIVAEYLTYDGQVLQAHGLGARITAAAEQARFPLLAASVLVMSILVVAFNRVVWKRCYQLSERRFSLNR